MKTIADYLQKLLDVRAQVVNRFKAKKLPVNDNEKLNKLADDIDKYLCENAFMEINTNDDAVASDGVLNSVSISNEDIAVYKDGVLNLITISDSPDVYCEISLNVVVTADEEE